MGRVFMKGCEAIAEAAVRAGCRFFAGYPITPQNEIPEYFARRMPEVGGVFVQGESEIASVNMVYGAAASGTRSMTSSSSCGISLKSEGISVCAAAHVPMVYCNVARGGPGVGSIQPAQQDYSQATKAGGNGGFRMLVFAPSTVQEAADLTYEAFDYAERDRNPVLILADGVIGTMMEPAVLPPIKSDAEIREIREALKAHSAVGHPFSERVLYAPGAWSTKEQEDVNKESQRMYEGWAKDVRVETVGLADAEIVVTAYGICGRIAKSAVGQLRREGIKAGLIRPVTVSPFPCGTFESLDYNRVKAILDVEMSIPAQMVYDVQLAVKGRCPVTTCLHSGGEIMSREEILQAVRRLAG